jgi:hypothetical protein
MRRRWVRVGGHPGGRRRGRFARELGRPGFDPRNVVCEVDALVEHGTVGGPPSCRAAGGVVALVRGRQLAWVAPPVRDGNRAGWIRPDWVTAWTLRAGELVVDYQPPPTTVHHHDPLRFEPRFSESRRLRAVADAGRLAAFVHRARRVLGRRG